MPLYRAYLIEAERVWAKIDLYCADDDEAKRQAQTLLDLRDIELWEGDRRVATLVQARNGSADRAT